MSDTLIDEWNELVDRAAYMKCDFSKMSCYNCEHQWWYMNRCNHRERGNCSPETKEKWKLQHTHKYILKKMIRENE